MSERQIIDLPRDAQGLFIQPDELTPELAVMVEHNRDRMAAKWEYADEHGTGNGKTVDIKGKYNCGACNQADNGICLAVYDDDQKGESPLKIDAKKGSCGKYERICLGDPELRSSRLPASVANYGVRKGGGPDEVFGCPQCPFAKRSKWWNVPNRPSRPLWCGKGAADVTLISCCTINGAPVVGDNDQDDDDYATPKGGLMNYTAGGLLGGRR